MNEELRRWADDPDAPEGLSNLFEDAARDGFDPGQAERLADAIEQAIEAPPAAPPGGPGTLALGVGGAAVAGLMALAIYFLWIAPEQPGPAEAGEGSGEQASAVVETTRAQPDRSDARSAAETSAAITTDQAPAAAPAEEELEAPPVEPATAARPSEPTGTESRRRRARRGHRRPSPSSADRPQAAATSPEVAPAPAAPDPEPAASEGAILLGARRALGRDPGRALRMTQEHARLFPDGRLVEERELIAIDALSRLGRRAAAQARGRRFIRRYPGSAHASRVRELIQPDDR